MESSAHAAGGPQRPLAAALAVAEPQLVQGLSSASKEAFRSLEPSRALPQPRGLASQKRVRPREVEDHAGTTGPTLYYNPQSSARRCCPREAVTQLGRTLGGGRGGVG